MCLMLCSSLFFCTGCTKIEVTDPYTCPQTSPTVIGQSRQSIAGLTQPLSSDPESTSVQAGYYELSHAERELICEVVMAESGGEPYLGQMAVAQCILNAAKNDNIRPAEVIEEYQYTSDRKPPSESVRDAVSAVFDRGEVAVEADILWFYAPALVTETPWHETQNYICTIAGHKFCAPHDDI